VAVQFSLDLRYPGQSHTLNLAWAGSATTAAAFHALHEQRYGHRMDLPVELVNVRCGLQGEPADIRMPPVGENIAEPGAATVAGCPGPVPVWDRAALGAGQVFNGPALISETVASTWLPKGWSCEVDGTGNLLLTRE
jgi:N-methylhydantoinase A